MRKAEEIQHRLDAYLAISTCLRPSETNAWIAALEWVLELDTVNGEKQE